MNSIVKNFLDLGGAATVGDYNATNAAANSALLRTLLVGNPNHVTIGFPEGTFDFLPDIYPGIYKRFVGAGRDVTTLRCSMNSDNGAFIRVDRFTVFEDLCLYNAGTNCVTSMAICSYTPVVDNGWSDAWLIGCRIQRFGIGIGAAVPSQTVNNPPPSGPTLASATPSGSGGTLGQATYHYLVAAVGAWGESQPSNELAADVPSQTGSVALAWNAYAGATAYKIYRRTNSGPYDFYKQIPVATSHTDSGSGWTALPPPPDPTGVSWDTPVATMVRGFVFDTKIWNNIFEDLYCPIQVGNSSNVVSIRGNLFTLTRGPRNIKLSETWMPIIDSDNVFQGTGTTVVGGIRYHNLGGIDIELTACWGAKIGGYFEPAMGILADGCPELELNGVTCASTMLSSGTNNALLATANTNRGYHYQMPLRSTVRNVTMDKDLSGKYLVNNFTSWISSVVPVDQHPDVLTLVDAINVRFPSGFTMYGNAAYPLLEEKAWTPTVIGDTGAIGTYADRFGYYIQRGRSVIAYFRVCWTNKGNLAGAVRIGGLPFKVRDVAPDGATIQYSPPAGISECAPITFPGAYGRIAAQGNPGTTEVAILQSSTLGATVSTANASMFGAFGIIIGSITYAID